MQQNSIELHGLTKRYDGFTLDSVDLELPAGAIMGFVGENGAGKTTTIKLLLGLVHRDAGTVRLLGMDSIEQAAQIKDQIGVVFDECNFHDTLSAREVAAILRNIYSTWDDALYKSLCSRFGLPDSKRIKEFSRGMKAKLSIAAAMAHHPRLLILDEATAGLDPVVRSEILDLFLEFIQDEACSIFFSSHITNDLERVADYIAFLHKGKLVFSKPKDELLDNYGLIRCGTEALGKLERSDVIAYRKSEFGCEALTADRAAARRKYGSMVVDSATMEEIMLLYIKGERL